MSHLEDNTIKTDLDFLECVIIGACTIESFAFQKIAHILTEKNFYLPFNKVIWSAMVELYPFTPIDSITVTIACKDKVTWFGALAHHLIDCQSMVNSSANLPYHAMILLENRLREAFEILLKSFTKTDSLLKQEILNEISKDFKECNSIFEMIPIWEAYAKKTEWVELAEAIGTLNNNINARITKLKQVSQMDTLMDHLINTYQVQSKHAKTIKLLSSAIASLAITGDMPFGFKKDLDHQLTAYNI